MSRVVWLKLLVVPLGQRRLLICRKTITITCWTHVMTYLRKPCHRTCWKCTFMDEYLVTIVDVKESIKHLEKRVEQLWVTNYSLSIYSMLPLHYLFHLVYFLMLLSYMILFHCLSLILSWYLFKKGGVTDENNYWSVAITTVVSKLF